MRSRRTENTSACTVDELRRLLAGTWVALVAAATLLPAGDAQARNAVQLFAGAPQIAIDDAELVVDVGIDFDDSTVGGGFEVTYDPSLLEFVDFTFVEDAQMLLRTSPPAGSTARPLVIGAGWLVLAPPFGVSGVRQLGTLRLRPVGEGNALLSVGPSAVSPGPFYSPAASTEPLAVEYVGTSVVVVPEPGFTSLAAHGALVVFGLGASRRAASRRASPSNGPRLEADAEAWFEPVSRHESDTAAGVAVRPVADPTGSKPRRKI